MTETLHISVHIEGTIKDHKSGNQIPWKEVEICELINIW